MSEIKEQKVLAAVIERSGRYLICRRPGYKRHGGLWEFPGGKLEEGESMAEAAVRELKEELGLLATRVGETYLSVKDGQSPYLVCFTAVETSGEPELSEHSDLIWATPSELLEKSLAPCDRRFAEFLASGLS